MTVGRIASLQRHPVKGFTPERLDKVVLSTGGHFPYDRIYGVARGSCGFDPAAPQHMSKQKFTVLANHPRLAQAHTRYEAQTGVFRVILDDGRPLIDADLSTRTGREALASWLTDFLGETEDGDLEVIASGLSHRFTDDRDGFVSLINLQSLQDLARRIGRPLDPLRLRANIHVDGWAPWAELDAAAGLELTLGEVVLQVIKPIRRCIATHVDPRTGTRDMDVLAALHEHYGHVNCGLYLRVTTGGRLAEGDAALLPPP